MKVIFRMLGFEQVQEMSPPLPSVTSIRIYGGLPLGVEFAQRHMVIDIREHFCDIWFRAAGFASDGTPIYELERK